MGYSEGLVGLAEFYNMMWACVFLVGLPGLVG